VKRLLCKIDKIIERDSFEYPRDFEYSVWDGDQRVAEGTSSSLDWVKNDAGGYHTKKNFDERYPGGWEVEYEWEKVND